MKRRETEGATRRKDEEIHIHRLEAEMESIRRDKDLELERLRAAAAQREEDKRIAGERLLGQMTEEAIHEYNLEVDTHSPRDLAATKKPEEMKNEPYEYSVIESFWQWKKEGTNENSRKLQLCRAQARDEHEMWV